MEIDDMIAVLQAHKEGKRLQYRERRSGEAEWRDLSGRPIWSFPTDDYRIRPEPPKPREFWVYPIGDNAFGVSATKGSFFDAIHVREVLPESNP